MKREGKVALAALSLIPSKRRKEGKMNEESGRERGREGESRKEGGRERMRTGGKEGKRKAG
jgi:hypothetical protein